MMVEAQIVLNLSVYILNMASFLLLAGLALRSLSSLLDSLRLVRCR